ncbi:hypothetical protein SFUMM280S_09684 [Streptomyces fumanus]
MAALLWAPLAGERVAVLINVPIRGFVERPRPFKTHQGLEVLVDGKNDYSFVSDHATLVMAMAVGLFVANRKFGIAGIVLALLGGSAGSTWACTTPPTWSAGSRSARRSRCCCRRSPWPC